MKSNIWKKAEKLADGKELPNRIVINEYGDAISPKRTGIEPKVIFVRDDGWSLGAPRSLWKVAHDLWKDHWIAVIHNGTVMTYNEFYQSMKDYWITSDNISIR